MISRTLFAALLISVGVASSADSPTPPKAPEVVVVDDYFGTKIADPYRYMENLKDPQVQNWMKAQADATAGVLARIPGREKLLSRIHELNTSATARINNINTIPGAIFYLKTLAGENTARLYMRKGLGGEEKLLSDPTKLDQPGGQPHAITFYSPSWSGKYVAVGISEGGSEQASVHIFDVAAGKEMSETIDRVWFGVSGWKDEHSFFYNRLQKMLPGMPVTEKEQKSTAWLHTIGTPVENDVAVLGFDRSAQVNVDPIDLPIVTSDPSAPMAVGLLVHGTKNEQTSYVAPLADVAPSGGIPWRKVADVQDEVTSFAMVGDDLYLLSHKDSPRYQILKTSASHPDAANAKVFLPQGNWVITDLQAAKDALYVRELDGPVAHLFRVPYAGGQAEQIQLPFEGEAYIAAADTRESGVLIAAGNDAKAQRFYKYDPNTKQVTDSGLQTPGRFDDPSDIVSEVVKVTSYDGVQVPLSLIHRKDIKLDGTNPTLLVGYGAYGIPLTPFFRPTMLAWIERGGVYAVAHVRGGGEYGDAWYKAGYKLTKANTWRDFIACAEYMVKQKYTSAQRLAGLAGSAGGILIGRAFTERPDLFGVAIDAVGCSDMLRAEFSENGVPNIPEFGSVKTQEGFEDLYAMSAYEHVKPGVSYPAVMLTTGINDPRVAPWQAAKMTARLQAASASGKPILLRVDYEGGHGVSRTKAQEEKEMADEFSFLLWQFGVPEFQPLRTQ